MIAHRVQSTMRIVWTWFWLHNCASHFSRLRCTDGWPELCHFICVASKLLLWLIYSVWFKYREGNRNGLEVPCLCTKPQICASGQAEMEMIWSRGTAGLELCKLTGFFVPLDSFFNLLGDKTKPRQECKIRHAMKMVIDVSGINVTKTIP